MWGIWSKPLPIYRWLGKTISDDYRGKPVFFLVIFGFVYATTAYHVFNSNNNKIRNPIIAKTASIINHLQISVFTILKFVCVYIYFWIGFFL